MKDKPPTVIDYTTPPPDYSECDELIADSETFSEAIFDIADKYGARVTNNFPRWQDGEYLQDVGEFIGDIQAQVDKFFPRLSEEELVEIMVSQQQRNPDVDFGELAAVIAKVIYNKTKPQRFNVLHQGGS